MSESKEISLQLGDVIKFVDEQNKELNEKIFLIDYIDNSKLVLINADTFEKIELKIKNGILGDGTISEIHILWRNEYPGYAKQHNLLPGTWINILFNGDIPTIITGKIINLEEDMIEVKTYPDKQVIYLNFDYKGLPENIPIENIEIREPVKIEKRKDEESEESEESEKDKESEESEESKESEKGKESEESKESEDMEPKLDYDTEIDTEQKSNYEEETKYIPTEKLEDKLREIVLQADELNFGFEDLEEITEYVKVKKINQIYDIETQTNDLLDEMLSTIPNSERTGRVLQNIHTMIERFKQLREQFSNLDEYGNVKGLVLKTAYWKPLLQQLLNFNKNLYWILPVVKNKKKIYNEYEGEYGFDGEDDVENIIFADSISKIENIFKEYASNSLPDEQDKYLSLYSTLNDDFTPFLHVDPENMSDIIYEKAVGENINVIIDNLGDFSSSVIDNKNIKDRRFVIQKYNLGLSRLVASQITGSGMTAQRVALSEPDEMSVTSLITLKEPVVRFSRINLPGTYILDRANLNNSFVQYWSLLKQSTMVNDITIQDYDLEPKKPLVEEYYDDTSELEEGEVREAKFRVLEPKKNENVQEKTFLKYVTNYSHNFTGVDMYTKFLDNIIPKTSALFNLIKKHISNKMSVVGVVSYMEPFLVYSDDLTFTQFKDIAYFTQTTIANYIKAFVEKSQAFNSLRNIWRPFKKYSSSINAVYNNIRDERDEIMETDYRCAITNTNGEILTKMTEKDNSRLYSSTLAFQNISLMFHDSMSDILEQDKEIYSKMSEEEKAADKCTTYVIAKQYTSEEELKRDNNVDIYFDTKYDTTNYSVFDDYSKEVSSMTPENFIPFIIEKLQKKLNLTQGEAEYLVESVLEGSKKVVDGQYAFIYNLIGDDDSIKYFKRVQGQWIRDESVDKSFFVTDNNILCNIKRDCIDVKDKCISTELNKTTLMQQTLNTALNEFDIQYNVSKEELKKQFKAEFDYNKANIKRIGKIRYEQKFKYNNDYYSIGASLSSYDSEKKSLLIVSPFQKLLDMILGQTDFVKKQNDIITFSLKFTREAMKNNVEETRGWRYCIQTSVPLLPAFLYSLAAVFVNNRQDYASHMDSIIKEIGKMSDDGDAWVDKNSGYIIRKIDFDAEEGYEDTGYKIVSRDVIDADNLGMGVGIGTGADVVKKPESAESRICSNIIDALAVNMGIKMDEQKEFIIQIVGSEFKNIPSREEYKKSTEQIKKGKVPSYEDYYNTTLIYMTFAVFLISVQTSIPSIKTKKTFPGCLRSFKGFPFEKDGDDSSIKYLACVAHKIRSSASPWYVLKKEETIAENIKKYINTFFLKNQDVIRKFNEKAKYLLEEPGELIIPDEHNVQNWVRFLPPLNSFKVDNLSNITPEFKQKLLNDLKRGGIYQRDSIMVIQSKIIFFSLGIQSKIREIIQKKQPLLKNAINEAFIENACCNEKEIKNEDYSVIDYFIHEDAEIKTYNTVVQDLTNTLYDIDSLTTAPWLFSRENTKNIYPSLNQEFDEDTIYRAFIFYCNFNTLLPISDELLGVCSQKPEYISEKEPVSEIIKKLKFNDVVYNNESLLRLLQTVGRTRIVITPQKVALTRKETERERTEIKETEKDTERERTEIKETESDNQIIATREMLEKIFYSSSVDDDELTNIKNYLSKSNSEMKEFILQFISQYNNFPVRTSKKSVSIIKQLFDKMTTWNNTNFSDSQIDYTGGYNWINFIKTYITNFSNTFPNIILNTVDYLQINVNKYWNLSSSHSKDIQDFVKKYYMELKPFYSNEHIISILQEVKLLTGDLVKLVNKTPYVSSSESSSSLDNRSISMIYEHYILLILMEYVKLTNNPEMLFVEEEASDILDDKVTIETVDDQGADILFTTKKEVSEEIFEGNKKKLQTSTANLLMTYLLIMSNHKNLVDESYDSIMDKVFKLREREKDHVTDRKKNMTDEERRVDQTMQENKLGIWSAGLQKGLTIYTKGDYDNSREEAEEFQKLERQLKNKSSSQFYDMDELREQLDVDAAIEQEEYGLSGVNEDEYWNGNPYGDEPIDSPEDYE